MKRLFAVLGMASALAVACSSGSSTPTTPSDGTATLGTYTFVVPAELSDVAVVFPDHLEFPASAYATLVQRPAGSVLVGDRASTGPNNPEGFLRKVTSVTQTADKTVVATTQATLLDAAPSITFQGSFDTPALGATGPLSAGGSKIQGQGKTVSLIDYSNKTVFDKTLQVSVGPNQNIGVEVFAKVNKGTLSFTPKWDVGADVSFLTIKSLHASATGQLDADLEVDAGVKLQNSITNDQFTQLVAQKLLQAGDATLADYTVNIGKMHVGPLPIPVNAHFVAKLACELQWSGGAEVVVGGKASASLTAGFKYDGTTVTPDFSKSTSFTQVGPNWTLDGVTKMSCTIHPQFELHLFDVAMAEVWADAYVDLGGTLTCGGTDANGNQTGKFDGLADIGAAAGVHAKVDVFGLYKWEKSCTLFDENANAQTSRTFVLPGGKNGTCTTSNVDQLTPRAPANPASCWGTDSTTPPDAGVGADGGPINGTCTHDVCTAGEPLGQKCDACTDKVCAKDPYCCDTFWGPSCFQDVQTECGQTCP